MVGCFQSGLDIAVYLPGKGIKLSHFVTVTPAQAKKRNISGYADFTEFCRTQNIKLYHVDRYDMKSKKRFIAVSARSSTSPGTEETASPGNLSRPLMSSGTSNAVPGARTASRSPGRGVRIRAG